MKISELYSLKFKVLENDMMSWIVEQQTAFMGKLIQSKNGVEFS